MNITFKNLTLYQLRQLAKEYKEIVQIKLGKHNKESLINELEKHLEIVDNTIQLKNKHATLNLSPPKRIFTEEELLEKEFKKLMPIKKKVTIEEKFQKAFPKKGGGIIDYIKNVFTPNDRYTNKTNNMLKKYGNFEITNIEVRRDPIINVIDKALNLISLGKWDDLKKKYDFDKLYHLYLIFTINYNGARKEILAEKNQSINISDTIPPKTDKTKTLMIGTNKGLTINSLLENTLNKVGKDQFFIYDPYGQKNCQNWVKDVLTSNGIYNDKIGKFVFQDISELAKELGYTTSIAKNVTDFAAFGERLLGLGMSHYKLHAVIVKKPATLEQLNDIKKEFVKDKKGFIRETKLTYRIRVIPKQRFNKSSFRTKKISKNISLVFGELKSK